MNATVVVRNRASIPVPADSLGAWRVVCQALGHRLFWDEAGGVLHVDSHLDGWTVILDPAHGGADRGSRGPAGHCEADFVLDVALRAAPRFSRLGATPVLTRDGDEAVSLADRIGPGRAAGPSLFISLHTSPAAGRHRVEAVYHLAGWPWAARLAAHLGRWLSRQTQLPWGMRCCLLPGSEEGYAGVLWRAGAGPSLVRRVPRRLAVLVYLGGQGDILGENRLADPAFREECAEGLLLGVLDFLMEYALEREGGMRLLEPVGYPPPSFGAAPPGTPSDSAPAGDPDTASGAAPVAAEPSAPRGRTPPPRREPRRRQKGLRTTGRRLPGRPFRRLPRGWWGAAWWYRGRRRVTSSRPGRAAACRCPSPGRPLPGVPRGRRALRWRGPPRRRGRCRSGSLSADSGVPTAVSREGTPDRERARWPPAGQRGGG